MNALVFSLIIFLPLGAVAILLALPRSLVGLCKKVALVVTGIVAALSISLVFVSPSSYGFAAEESFVQQTVVIAWIPEFHIYYFLGLDGFSFPLVIMTSVLVFFATIASWNVDRSPKSYFILLMLLSTGILGVFLTLDFFLFYIFFEVVLLPMYFLIGIWGGPRKEYAAFKFFLYTLFGSVLILVGLLMVYFTSDLTQLDATQLARAAVPESVVAQIEAAQTEGAPVHSFNLLALREFAQTSDDLEEPLWLGKSIGWWAFLFLLIGFLIKVPVVPLHTWLPDAHVEAPTPVSMLLAGVLLKVGAYGLMRVCFPLCPAAAMEFAPLIATLGAISILYGAFAALAQVDFKALVAYSSISHMGYVILGLAAWSANPDTNYSADYWAWGLNGAVFQMVAHGITSAAMFFIVGMLYDRVQHRDLNKMGAVYREMPVFSGLSFGIFFAAMGLPGLCGFVGEIFVLLSAWKYSHVLALMGALTLILTAGYILWMLQRVFFGPEYLGTGKPSWREATPRELVVLVPLFSAAVLLGVFPHQFVLRYTEASVTQVATELSEWSERHEELLETAMRVPSENSPNEKVVAERDEP